MLVGFEYGIKAFCAVLVFCVIGLALMGIVGLLGYLVRGDE